MKTCCRCHKEKDESEFHKNRNKPDGLQNACKTCRREIDADAWRNSPNRKKIIKETSDRMVTQAKALILSAKASGCVSCGETEPCALDFHHLDPSEKDYEVSHMHKLSLKKIQNELDKCIVLCANCHRKVHAGLIKV